MRKKLREQKDINDFILDSVTVSEAPEGMMMVPATDVYRAAPELYAALEWSLDVHDELEKSGIVHYDPDLSRAIRELAKARAALAKARGES